MIIVREFSEVVRQAGFTEYDHVIQALPPNGQTVKKLVEIRCPGAMCTKCLNKDRYSPWIRRLRRPTTSDQNRSCKTTLSIPNTMISSHRPELTQNHIVSPDPSIRLSTLSAKMTKHTSAASW